MREEFGVAERRVGGVGGRKGDGAGVFGVEDEDEDAGQRLRGAGGEEMFGVGTVEEDFVEGHCRFRQMAPSLLG